MTERQNPVVGIYRFIVVVNFRLRPAHPHLLRYSRTVSVPALIDAAHHSAGSTGDLVRDSRGERDAA